MRSIGDVAEKIRAWLDGLAVSHGVPTFFVDFGAWILAGIFLLVLVTVVSLVAIYLERKVAGYVQSRLGPMRVGPIGIFQTAMDAFKLLQKEDIVPAAADKYLHTLGPVLSVVATLMMFAVVPWERGANVAYWLDAEVGLLYLSAVSGVGVLGLVCGGWGSNNKWSLLGAMRGAAQLISYEIPFLLAAVCVVLQAETLSLTRIVELQQSSLAAWFAWKPWLWLPLLLFIIAGVAEVKRTPFDIPEAESELVAGFHTEYSGMKFALFMLAEYAHLYMLAILFAILFVGGWASPFGGVHFPIEGFVWLQIKAWAFVLLCMWIRWTLPRLRVDQLLEFSWKLLVPAGFVAIFITTVALLWA